MTKFLSLFSFVFILALSACDAQVLDLSKDKYKFSEADSLRGMLRPERTAYDVTFYDLFLKIDPDKKYISGKVIIEYQALADFNRLQVDLFSNMRINSIIAGEQLLNYERKHNAVFIDFPSTIVAGSKGNFTIAYQGKPIAAQNAPWDGGFVWKEDPQGNPWIGVACEGTGASLWWPNKDHLSDEPDSMRITTVVPKGLISVSNGHLRKQASYDEDYDLFEWFISYPINNYNVTVNIAKYVHFSEIYTSPDDGETMPMDYYVLAENLSKAKNHFRQTRGVLACFEKYFGKYPFWKDGFALVETPYLGMEHQGAIAYGNEYKRGYLGGMVPQEFNFDYIIVHETGHEYFGNSISTNDHAEMWIHESFTTYMETIYVECRYGYEAAVRYINSQRSFIENYEPILGPMDVNFDRWEGSDHYFKGAWVLHTLRHALNNDELFFSTLKSLHEENKISHMTTRAIIEHFNTKTNRNWDAFFKQYLEYKNIPTLEYKIKQKRDGIELRYKWNTEVGTFDMPIAVGKEEQLVILRPSQKWQKIKLKEISQQQFKIATDLFLINTKRLQ